jgi:hypothetical protein
MCSSQKTTLKATAGTARQTSDITAVQQGAASERGIHNDVVYCQDIQQQQIKPANRHQIQNEDSHDSEYEESDDNSEVSIEAGSNSVAPWKLVPKVAVTVARTSKCGIPTTGAQGSIKKKALGRRQDPLTKAVEGVCQSYTSAPINQWR